jgi:hypothetical protein
MRLGPGCSRVHILFDPADVDEELWAFSVDCGAFAPVPVTKLPNQPSEKAA